MQFVILFLLTYIACIFGTKCYHCENCPIVASFTEICETSYYKCITYWKMSDSTLENREYSKSNVFYLHEHTVVNRDCMENFMIHYPDIDCKLVEHGFNRKRDILNCSSCDQDLCNSNNYVFGNNAPHSGLMKCYDCKDCLKITNHTNNCSSDLGCVTLSPHLSHVPILRTCFENVGIRSAEDCENIWTSGGYDCSVCHENMCNKQELVFNKYKADIRFYDEKDPERMNERSKNASPLFHRAMEPDDEDDINVNIILEGLSFGLLVFISVALILIF